MAVGDLYELSLVGIQTGSEIVSTFKYRTETAVGSKQDEMLALAEEFLNTGIPSIAAICSDSLAWHTIRVRDIIDPINGIDRSVSASGAVTGDFMPKQVAALILWRTGFIGRSRQGRLYLPAVTEAQFDGEEWDSGFQASVTGFAGAINLLAISDFPDTGDDFTFQQGVYSTVEANFFPIISFGLQPVPATQRRRRSGVGS